MNAAIYARKSQDQTGVNEDAKSVARQIERARAFAAKNGWAIAAEHIFLDEGISGAEFESRDGLMRLLDALKPKPAFGTLIVMNKDRLGREQYEASYNLKRLAQAGVRVFEYLDAHECLLDTPMDKFIESVGNFAAEQERFQASRRTRDALARKAEQGYVTGGAVFGYTNEPVYGDGLDAKGERKRQYVVRKISGEEAGVVRCIFEMRAKGIGFKKIAIALNLEGVTSPRPRRPGRPRSWTPSSVRGILLNPIYIGQAVWGRTKKRDSWGLKKYLDRPKDDWIIRQDEKLRVISDDLWEKVQAEIETSRMAYGKGQGDRLEGRPPSGTESKYLLSGFVECGICGGGMYVWSRDFKTHRRHIYICGYHHERGSAVCSNGLPMPMDAADTAVLDTIDSDLLRGEVIDAAVEEAVQMLQPSSNDTDGRRKALQAQLAVVEAELAQYAKAIAVGVDVEVVVKEINARKARRDRLVAQLEAVPTAPQVMSLDAARIRDDLRGRLADWQGLLKRHIPEARQILRNLLVGRLVFTPREDGQRRYYEFTGQGSISAILRGIVVQEGRNPAGVTNTSGEILSLIRAETAPSPVNS